MQLSYTSLVIFLQLAVFSSCSPLLERRDNVDDDALIPSCYQSYKCFSLDNTEYTLGLATPIACKQWLTAQNKGYQSFAFGHIFLDQKESQCIGSIQTVDKLPVRTDSAHQCQELMFSNFGTKLCPITGYIDPKKKTGENESGTKGSTESSTEGTTESSTEGTTEGNGSAGTETQAYISPYSNVVKSTLFQNTQQHRGSRRLTLARYQLGRQNRSNKPNNQRTLYPDQVAG
ncbi:MAG: hypothetical protein M1829_003882 [Trizodia sp. TS-e1964]|nr:MAG: hypothetical protein M1829_003882 [Trizodia sp. TS-e1964]